MAGVIKFGILRNFARACLVLRDAARITSILQYLHTSHVQLSSFVKMYFFNACYRRFVNNQVLFSSVQRHQIIFATKDFSRGEFFVLTVFWLICIWLTLIHSKFVNCPCCSFLSLWYFLLQIKFLYRLSICVNLTMYLLWLYLWTRTIIMYWILFDRRVCMCDRVWIFSCSCYLICLCLPRKACGRRLDVCDCWAWC